MVSGNDEPDWAAEIRRQDEERRRAREEMPDELRQAADVLDETYADIQRERLRRTMESVGELERLADQAPDHLPEERRDAARELLAVTKHETGWVAAPCIRAAAEGEAGVRALLDDAERMLADPLEVVLRRDERLQARGDPMSPPARSLSTPDQRAAEVVRQATLLRTWAQEYLKLFHENDE